MIDPPLISICIPAYKRIDFLQRLLASISDQTYRNFEVVVTDDSPDDTVKDLCLHYKDRFSIFYYRNKKTLGTPANWNEAILKARGQWIKLMHDDDWFTEKNSLQVFYQATLKNPDCSFFFSAFQNIDAETNIITKVYCNWLDRLILSLSPLHLFKKVYVGNPSCTLIRRSLNLFYDDNFKWVVDFEYYIRCLQKTKSYHYIDQILLNIGFNKEQVTNSCFRIPEVEIPECHLMLEKFGARILHNIVVYDYYWRLYRNLGIRNERDLADYYNKQIPSISHKMLKFQSKIPLRFLKAGVVSKLLMTSCYLLSLFNKP